MWPYTHILCIHIRIAEAKNPKTGVLLISTMNWSESVGCSMDFMLYKLALKVKEAKVLSVLL